MYEMYTCLSDCCHNWSGPEYIKQDWAPDPAPPGGLYCCLLCQSLLAALQLRDGTYNHRLLCCAFTFCLLTLPPLPCSFMMEYDIHTLLDFLTLLATVWVIYMLRFPLRSSYQDKEDSLKFYFVVSLVEGLLCCTGGAMQPPACALRCSSAALLSCRSLPHTAALPLGDVFKVHGTRAADAAAAVQQCLACSYDKV